ncbi:MAG: serine hydroxymethyltransferase, partial [bacterium]
TKKKYADAIDRAVFPGVQAGPLMHQIAAKAVCFQEAKSFGFKEYQKQIVLNAAALAETLNSEGFNLITGGTDNHLMLVDLTEMGLSGREAADLLEEAGIIVNFNSIPYDKKTPMVTSGIRPGTPAITTRGMKEEEMQVIGKMFSRVLKNPGDEKVRIAVAGEVGELCEQFPIYRDLMQW